MASSGNRGVRRNGSLLKRGHTPPTPGRLRSNLLVDTRAVPCMIAMAQNLLRGMTKCLDGPEDSLDMMIKPMTSITIKGSATSRAWSPSLGAWPGDGGAHFRVWAPRARKVEVVVMRAGRGPRSHGAREGAGRDLLRIRGRGPGRGSVSLRDRRPGAVPRPGEPLPARGGPRALGGGGPGALSLVRPGLEGPHAGGAGRLRAARRHLQPRGDLRGRREAAGDAPGPGGDGDRADAPGRLRRAPELGLRRRGPVRPGAMLRHAGRPRRLVDEAHRLGLGGDARRRLQPLRARRATTPPSSASSTSRPAARAPWAACVNLDERGERARPASSSSRTPCTGCTSITSTACAWTPRTP